MTTNRETLPFRDPDLPLDDRVRDLISRLTLAEKLSQLGHAAAPIPRLRIGAYNYLNEGLHGVARNGRATVFPQAIGLAATWDPALIERVAGAIADEARAKHHAAVRASGASGMYQGLTLWAPNVNIFRDPRWGRGQETWGEDPWLTGELASAFVRGLQGDDPRYLKTAACAKHFAVHSGPEKQRHSFDARPSLQDLHDTYLPAFKRLVVEARVEAVMGAYNRLYGEPCCASQLLLNDLLRGAWGFAGHVVSDCGALSDFHRHHRVTASPAESAALALRQGCDIGCDEATAALGEAVERGLVSEAEIDRALARGLRTRFRLGLFDPPDRVPYARLPLEVVCCAAHRRLAYQAAVESIVLLKNQNNVLPVSPEVRSILVVGPGAASADVLLGNYFGLSPHLTTLLEGLVAAAPPGLRLDYRPGCLLAGERLNRADVAEHLAAEVDLVIACLGLSPLLEGEENDALLTPANGDRAGLGLPPGQAEYLARLAATGTPLVLLLTGGSPLALGAAADLADAILFLWYPGEAGGQAAADIVFGKANPSGRLPVSFPRSEADLPPFDDYGMAGRTYRYAAAPPAYPFGFGLSYTRFAYRLIRATPRRVRAGRPVRFVVEVHNTGARAGREVAQVYVRDEAASARTPRWKLAAMRSVWLKPGQARTLRFSLPPAALELIDEQGQPRLEPGYFRVWVGGCSPSEAAAPAADGKLEQRFELIE